MLFEWHMCILSCCQPLARGRTPLANDFPHGGIHYNYLCLSSLPLTYLQTKLNLPYITQYISSIPIVTIDHIGSGFRILDQKGGHYKPIGTNCMIQILSSMQLQKD